MQFQYTQELGVWAYLLLALLVMVEGPVATLAGAVASASGLMKPTFVFVAAASGNLLGDSLWYTLGLLGKVEWLERYGSLVGLKAKTIIRLQDEIQRHAARLLVIAKLTLGFTIPTLVATGLARVPVRRWLPFLVMAETVWTGLLVILGYRFGEYLSTLERGVEIVALAGSLLFVTIIVIYLSHFRKRSAEDVES